MLLQVSVLFRSVFEKVTFDLTGVEKSTTGAQQNSLPSPVPL